MVAEPVTANYSLPEDTERPSVEPMSLPRKKKSQGVRVSNIKQSETMPEVIRTAVSKSAAPQTNIFDQQNQQVAVVDDIMSALSMMGEDTTKFKKKDADVQLEFQEYKAKPKKQAEKKPAAEQKPAEPALPLTKEEIKRQKREEKINAKFKKDLAKRGF